MRNLTHETRENIRIFLAVVGTATAIFSCIASYLALRPDIRTIIIQGKTTPTLAQLIIISTPVPPTPISIPPTLTPSCQLTVRAFDASDPSDFNQVLVNGVPIIELPTEEGLLQDSAWVNIDDELKPGQENVVRFTAYNHGGMATWGFNIGRGEETLVDERGSSPANTATRRLVFGQSYALGPDCQVRRIEPAASSWIFEINGRGGASISLDGVVVLKHQGSHDRTSQQSVFDMSPFILPGQQHVIYFRYYDPGLYAGHKDFQITKDAKVIFSLDGLIDGSQNLYVLNDGRLSVTPP